MDDGEAVQISAQATENLKRTVDASRALMLKHLDLIAVLNTTLDKLKLLEKERDELQKEVESLRGALDATKKNFENETAARQSTARLLEDEQAQHRKTLSAHSKYCLEMTQSVIALPFPKASPVEMHRPEFREAKVLLGSAGIPVSHMPIDEWREVVECIEAHKLATIPDHEPWWIEPRAPIDMDKDAAQIESLRVLAALQPGSNRAALHSLLARLCSRSIQLGPGSADVGLVALTLRRLLMTENLTSEIVFMAAVAAGALGFDEIKSTITGLLSNVPPYKERDRRPFDDLSTLALSDGFGTDALRRHCEAAGIVWEDLDVGIVMGPHVYVLFEFGLRRAHVIHERDKDLLKGGQATCPDRVFKLSDGRRIRVTGNIPLSKHEVLNLAWWKNGENDEDSDDDDDE
ncbi:hypothetical protein QBC39DRAFT_376772 [Podospora conica]|nr:hypothetical protein QBC39DRAFT_376772 [Schizothecium conicum]